MKGFLLAISVSLFFSGLFAQTEFPFEHIPIPGSIRSSQINDIVLDKNGIIWFAGDGLFRFDGFKITPYKLLSPTESLGGREVICLLVDKMSNNKLYLGTHSYGIVEYNYNTNTFRTIPSKGGVPIVGMLAQTDDGTLWAGSFSNGLFRVENDTLKKVPDNGGKYRILTSLLPMKNKLLVDKQRKIYTLENGIIIDSLEIHYDKVEFPVLTRITSMIVDSKGQLWLGMDRGGVLLYDTLKKDFIKYFSPDRAPFYHRINQIFEAANGNIWILSKANGLAIYNPTNDQLIHLTKNALNESSLSGNNCTSIIEDSNGIFWIGATGDLNKYDPTKIKFQHIYNNPFNALSLNDNMVRGVLEDTGEKLWIGTDGGVIHIIDRKNSTIEKIPVTISGSSQHIVPVNFLQLDKNTMLIGSSVGLLQMDLRSKKISYYPPFENKIKNRQVRQILKDSTNLYFTHTGSVFIHNLVTGSTVSFSEFTKGVNNATAIYLDLKGRLWVGVNNGVALHIPESNSFRFFEFEKNNNRPPGSYFMVLSIAEHNNKLWVGTFNSGLWTLDLNNLDNPEIKNLSEHKNLPDNTIYATIPDDKGNLWLSSNQGILKYDLEHDLFINFGLSDGVQHEEFNRLAATKCRNGEIVFGGINGLNIFDPKKIEIKEETYKPKLFFVSIYNNTSSQEDYIGLLDKESIELKSDENNLDFQFFVPNFRTPKRFDLYYQLTGFDPGWIKTESNSIHYANIAPGTYTLKLKTISSGGVENLIEFPVKIKEPIWLTWWFITIVLGVVALVIFIVVRINIENAKRDKLELEKLLRLRTQEIEKSREELANLNQKKDVIFSILSHDLRSPLTTLKGFLSLLIDNTDLLSKEDIKKHSTIIRNSVTSSLDLIDNTLFWSLSQTGNITYTPTSFSLNQMFKKINDLYQLTAAKKQIQFSINCDENINVYGDENMIYVTLRNLVSNALKFTPDGKTIQLSASKNHKFAEIIVKDQGIGMSPVYLEKLLSEDHLQLKLGTSNEKGTGLGIILCKKFIQMNGGQLHVKSTDGQGSEFKVSLPIAQD